MYLQQMILQHVKMKNTLKNAESKRKILPENSSEGNAGHSEENWDWGEETSENMPTFEGDYEGFFEMYNLQSDQILCQTV